MPTVDAIRVRCPECGATSKVAGDVIKCEYCGTESRVQRRAQTVFQMPLELPAPEPHHPKPIARQVRTRIWPIVLAIAAPILLPVVLISTIRFHRGTVVIWQGDQTVVDVDGDGTDDIVGFIRYLDGDHMNVRAVSGKDGHAIWETASLGNYHDTYQSMFRTTGSTLLRAATGRSPALEAFDLKTGKKLWTAQPSETIAELCRDTDPALIDLHLADQTAIAAELATGKLSQTIPKLCDPIGGGQKPFDVGHHGFRTAGMSIEELFGANPPYIASGTKSPGTGVPMIAAFDDADRLLWKSELPSHDSHLAERAKVAFRDELIVGAWGWQNRQQDPGVTAFDRATGKRLWEATATYSGKMFVTVEDVIVGKGIVFVHCGDSVQGFDPQTGKRRFVVGKSD